MRLTSEARVIESGGIEEEGEFKVKGNGKAFRVLMDGLYSKKIPSIVRELPSNAYDAHISLGNPAPFFVHKPTLAAPEFYVRDYGVGMSHQKVMGLYTTLFDSDKDHSNDLVGAFGLGSKSPFAYTDQFYVTCYDGETARHYTASLGEGGIPKIMLGLSTRSDEPLGVRVGFAVAGGDHRLFEDAIGKTLLGFDPPFETNFVPTASRGTKLYDGNGWSAYIDSHLQNTWNVRQGCVIYPLEGGNGVQFSDDYTRKFLIEAPIGTVEVTTSREQIAYSPSVVDYLNGRINAVEAEVEALVWAEVKDIENVALFFKTLNTVKPMFLHTAFVHPFTGLNGTTAKLSGHACVWESAYSNKRMRWESTQTREVRADLPGTAQQQPVYWVTDIAALLDVERSDPDHANKYNDEMLSVRERNRIMRLIRNWLDQEEANKGIFYLGVDWTDEFYTRVKPTTDRRMVTVEQLKRAIPKKRLASQDSKVRGVSFTETSGSAVSVETLVTGSDTVWVTAEEYRRDKFRLQQLGKRFGFKKFYIALKAAYKTMNQSGIPHLRDAISDALKKRGTSWQEWGALSETMPRYAYILGSYLQYGKNLLDIAPDQFEKLAAAPIIPGKLLRNLKPFLAEGLIPFSEDERGAIKLLAPDEKIKPSPRIVRIKALMDGLDGDTSSPVSQYLHAICNADSPAQMAVTVKGLIALYRLFPTNVKFKDYK